MGEGDAALWVLLREERGLGWYLVGAIHNAAKLPTLVVPGLWYATG